jgi:hypothetical protein
MRSLIVFSLCLLFSGTALAYDEEESEDVPAGRMTGLALSAGIGYAAGFGDILKTGGGADLSDNLYGQVPIMFGAGVRASSLVAFGISVAYAPGIPKGCESGSSCSAHDTVVEGEVRLHFEARDRFSSWLSAGIGYEWLTMKEKYDSATFKGKQFSFLFGGDYRLGPAITVGPFVGFRFGSFSSMDAANEWGSGSGSIDEGYRTWHTWLLAGFRTEATL